MSRIEYRIGPGVTLRTYLRECLEDEENGTWMLVKDEAYSLNMLVFPVIPETWDLEPEEYEALEDDVLSGGWGNCLQCEQLVDIVDNLKSQNVAFTDTDLEKAINHYSAKDAFLDLKNA